MKLAPIALVIGLGIFFPMMEPTFAEEESTLPENLVWLDVSTWGVEGQGWEPELLAERYDRFPAKAKDIVRPPVWNLSHHSSGLSFRFTTDSTELYIRYEVGSTRMAMFHMPATGVSGIDLYSYDEDRWRWVDVSHPNSTKTTLTVKGIDPGTRSYLVYLPLYNSIKKIEVAVPKGAKLEPIAPRKEKPMVFYGTSILQGGCASRPGMPHPAILSRRLDQPFINLGFSGNGMMEPEVGALLAEIDASIYVLDCVPNMAEPLVSQRTVPFVKKLREARPDVPIVLVEDRTYSNSWILKEKRDRNASGRSALVHAYDTLIEQGVKNLYYIPGDTLQGDDDEATVDGSHATDLGFVRQADAMEPTLRKALGLE